MSNSSLIIHLINARSICNKIDYLNIHIDHYKPDVLAITETWGRAPLTDSLVTPSGFNLFRKDREVRAGGGVMLLGRSVYNPIPFEIPDTIFFNDSVWCTIPFSPAKSILVGYVYRSPSSDSSNDKSLFTLFDFVSSLVMTIV